MRESHIYTRVVADATLRPTLFPSPSFPAHTMRTPALRLGRLFALALCVFLTGCKIEKIDTASTTSDGGESETAAATLKAADGDQLKFAYVTNCVASFWVIADKGCEDAARDLGVECLVRMPPKLDAAE